MPELNRITVDPYLEVEDIPQALEYAAWRSEELELPLAKP